MNTLNGYSKSTLTDNYILTAAGGHIPLGNASGNVPLSNGTVNTNLRSEYSQFLLGVTIDIEVAGDKETYYPVSIKFCARKELPNIITIWKDLGSKTAAYTGNHSNGTSSMLYRYECRNNGWDGNQTYFKTLVASYGYARLVAHTEISSKDYGLLIIWLRGGGTTYKISADYPLKYNATDYTKSDIRICYETTNIGSSSFPVDVSPKTTIENAGIYSLGYFGYGNFSGHATTADTATNATYANNVPVSQHTDSDVEWPIVWSNQNNTNNATANLLYKSHGHLSYNTNKQRISVNNLWSTSGVLTINSNSDLYLKRANDDTKSIVLNSSSFKPFDVASGKLTLGSTAARWSTIYGINGDYTGSLNVTKEVTACNKHFNIGLAFNEFPAFSLTGAIVIKMPNGWTNSMNSYEIDLYEYSTNGHSKIYVSGYNYLAEKRWYATSYHVVGNYNYPVRLGYYEITNSDNSKSPRMCIILGDITSKWDFTQVHLTGVYAGRDAYNAWSSGYTIEMVSDKTVFDATYKGLNTLTRSGWNLGPTKVEGNITATKFIKTDGTSSQFLKADGSIDNNTYVTTTQLGNYLPLAGGTMTGPITFTSGSSAGAFAKTAISFISVNNVEQARIGTDNSNSLGIYSKSTIYIRPNHTFDSSTSYGLVLNHSNITYNGNKMWHAGNDGAGSGLDADLLDGLQLNDVVYRSAVAREAFTDHIFHNVQNINNSIIVETANTYPTVTTTNNTTTIDDSNITWSLVAEGSVSQYLNVFDHNKTTYAPSNWIGLRYTVPISEYAELSLLYISHAFTGKTGYVVSVDFINASNVVTNYYKKLIEYLYTESCTIKFTGTSSINTKIRITILKKDSDLPNLAISLICGYSARGGSQGAACNYGINYHGRYVFRPYINNVWSLGTSSYKFKDIYATTLYGNLNGSYINALTGYSKASSISSIVATDTLNTALGKLEYKADYVYNWLTSVADDDEYINKWGEIVEFLDSVKEGTDILDEFVTRKTDLTIIGKKTFSKDVYFRFSDATLKFYEIAGSAGASNGSETMCILTCFDQQDPKTSDYVTNYPLRTTLALQPRGGTVGIGTATPKQTLDILGNIQISSKGSSKAPKLVIHEYYDGSNDWISEIVSDYWGANTCTKSGFTHGLYIKLGRNLTFSNLNILDADKNPIARISKEKGHWFDGDVTATNFIGPATHIKSGGRLTAETTTNRESGLRFYQIFENGYPFGYGNVIQVNGANGVSQLAMEWYGTRLAYRSAPDTSTTFTDWATLITDKNYTSYTVKKDGTGANGTWDITSSKATSLVSTDSRSVEDTPTTYNKGLYAAFKYNGINAMSDGGNFYGLLHFRPYGSNTDFSGGYPHLLAFTENQRIWYRKAINTTEWHNWKLLAFLSDLSSYATTTYVDTAIANAQLDGSNVTIPVTDVKVKTSASSSAVTVINADKEAIIDLSTYAKLADLPKSLPLTPILTYDAISPIGAYAYENANGDVSTNGFVFANSSAAFGWGKSNCLVILAAQAGQSTPTIFIKQYYLSWGDWYALVHSGNVNQYAPKWDGTNAKGTWNISILGKAAGITGYTFKTLTAKSTSGWTNNTTDDKIIPTMSFIAYWNGAYSGTNSNLTYCYKGAFGDAAVKGVTTSVTNGDTNLVTSGGVYSYINTISGAYLPLAGGTLTGNLNFNSLIPITWTGGTYQLRINTIDDAVTGTDVFQFLQSSDSGTNWKTLLSIRDEGTINLTGGEIPDLSAYWQSPAILQSDNIAQTIWIGTGSPMSYSLISGNNKLTIFDQTITVGTNNKLFINFEIPSLVVGLRGGYDTASADEWSILLTPIYYIYLNGTLYKTISEPGYVVETNTNNNVSVRIEIKISYPQLSTGDVFLVWANGPYYSSLNNLAIQLTGVINVNYEECANSNVYNSAVSIVNKEGFLICDTAKTNITYSNSDMFFIKRGSKCFKITNDGVLLSSDEGISWKLLQLLN